MSGPDRLFDPDELSGSPPAQVTPGPLPSGSPSPEPDRDRVVVRVLPEVSGLDREFDYLAAPDQGAAVGSLVRVELQRRTVSGWITEVGSAPPAGLALGPILKVLSVGPSADLVALARWAANRWCGRLGPVLRAATPPRLVTGLPPTRPAVADAPAGAGGPAGVRGSVVTVARVPPAEDVVAWVAQMAGRGTVVVVTPRVGQALHLVGRLRAHGIPARSHPRDWAAAAARGGVVVGARSAVWARVPDLAGIVVVDEHDETLQEERNPTWHARDVAVERARRAGVPCLLLSPCPSLAALALADEVREPARARERAGWPVVEVIDRRQEEPGRGGLFSPRVAAVVRGPGRVLAVLNRKGRAVMLACALCGELARTADGERLMVEVDGRLICPATGEERPMVCGACGAAALKRLRLGVARAAEELAALAGEAVDEVTAGTGLKEGRVTRITVGTEAALHQFSRLDAVIFLDFDQEILAPRLRSSEQAMALLALAARVVGPRSGGARIVIQTRTPEHRVIQAAIRADPGRLAAADLPLRRAMGLPPFGALAEVSGPAAGALASALAGEPEVTVLGPRDDGRYLIKAPDADRLSAVLHPSRRPPGRLRVAVDPPRA